MTEHEYTSYPRRFSSYKWFKPLLLVLAWIVSFALLQAVFSILTTALGDKEAMTAASQAAGSYDTMDAYTVSGAIISMGIVVLILPALAIATKIVRDRPFSSYSSSMGGFRFDIFFKCLLPALVAAIPTIIVGLSAGKVSVNRFTVGGFIVLTLLCPLQCLAEEYLFRGLIMQTVGSWTKIWFVGVLAQVVLFALMHPYNLLGVVSVSVMGLALGFIAWYTHGLEATGALHTVNNLTAFYLSGFGFSQVQTEVPLGDVLCGISLCVLYIVMLVLLQKKNGMFDKVKRDDVTPWNERWEAKKKK